MLPLNVFRYLFQNRRRQRRRVRRPRLHHYRPTMEMLEAREVPTAINWIGGAFSNICQGTHSGDPTAWNNPFNWQGGRVPGAGDTAVFPANFTIANCSGRPVTAPFNRTPVVTMQTTAAGINAGVNDLTSLTVNQNLTLTGSSEWDSGTLNVASGALLDNRGTFRMANPAVLTFNGGGELFNGSTGIVQEAGNADLQLNAGARILNDGLYDIQTDHGVSSTSTSATFSNGGTLQKSGGTGISRLALAGGFRNGRNITVQRGTLIPWDGNGGQDTSGAYTVAGGAVLQYADGNFSNTFSGVQSGSGGGKMVLNIGTIAGDSIFEFAPGFFEWDAGTLNGTGRGFDNQGTITLTGPVTKVLQGTLSNDPTRQGTIIHTGTGNLQLANATLDNRSLYDFRTDAGFVSSGGLPATVSNEGTIRKSVGVGVTSFALNSGFNNIGGALDVRTGTLTPQRGTWQGVQSINVVGGAVLDLLRGNVSATWSGSYIMAGGGTIRLGDGTLHASGANFSNSLPAVQFQMAGGNLIADNSTLEPGIQFQLTGGTLTANAGLGNFGTFTWLAGTITLGSGGLTNGGTFTLTNAANVVLGGTGTLTNTGTIIQRGTGSLLTNATINNQVSGTYFLDSSIRMNGSAGTINNAGTISSAGSVFVDANLTNSGTLAVPSGGSLRLNQNFTNFAGTTLTGGAYLIAGTLQFNGANIVTNDANLILDGSGAARIVDQNGNNALANFTLNDVNGGLTVQNFEGFTTAGDFNNQGYLAIDGSSSFTVGGNLANFDPGSCTFSGGTWIVAGTLQFNGANIITNDANLILDGSGPGQIVDENGNNALANFAVNDVNGSLTLQNGYVLTTGGDFSNLGYLLLDSTSMLAVSGNFSQGSAAALEIQLDVGTSGQLTVAGNANLGGTFILTPVNGYVPSTGDTFQVMTFASRNGSDFANPPAGFNEVFDDSNGILSVVAQ